MGSVGRLRAHVERRLPTYDLRLAAAARIAGLEVRSPG